MNEDEIEGMDKEIKDEEESQDDGEDSDVDFGAEGTEHKIV